MLGGSSRDHAHLSFLSHGEGSARASGSGGGLGLGGFAYGGGLGGMALSAVAAPPLRRETSSAARTDTEKMVDIVEYLQAAKRNQQATLVDIFNDVSVDLQGPDVLVFDMLKSNPKIIVEDDHGSITLQFLTKFEIKCRADLINLIDKLKLGLSRNEVRDSYPGILEDIADMVSAGEVIGVANQQQDVVLYPRRQHFLTELAGHVTLTAGSNIVSTSEDLRAEIRRGDAILLGDTWYRISSVISTSSLAQQPFRAKPPASVSSLEEMNARNEYLYPYTDNSIPLSVPIAKLPSPDECLSVVKTEGAASTGEQKTVRVKAYKHGCTNDLRDKWHKTFEDMKSRRLVGDDKLLENELLRLGLISGVGAFTDRGGKRSGDLSSSSKAKRPRKKRVFKETNTHLKNTHIGNLLKNMNNA